MPFPLLDAVLLLSECRRRKRQVGMRVPLPLHHPQLLHHHHHHHADFTLVFSALDAERNLSATLLPALISRCRPLPVKPVRPSLDWERQERSAAALNREGCGVHNGWAAAPGAPSHLLRSLLPLEAERVHWNVGWSPAFDLSRERQEREKETGEGVINVWNKTVGAPEAVHRQTLHLG